MPCRSRPRLPTRLADIKGLAACFPADPEGLAGALAAWVDQGVDLDAPLEGQPPLCWAVMSGHLGLVQALLAAGANPMTSLQGLPAFRQAVVYNEVAMVQAMLATGQVDAAHRDRLGNTAFHDACTLGNPVLIDVLVAADAAGLSTNESGQTALDIFRDTHARGVHRLHAEAAGQTLSRLEPRVLEKLLDRRIPRAPAGPARSRM